MASRTLPNLALKGFWLLGEDGWKTENDLNLLKLSVLTQGGAISKVAATPGAPTDGDVHIFDETHPTQPNAVAIRDDGAWVYVTPSEGWLVYNRAANYFEVFDGTVWAELATGGGGGGSALEVLDEGVSEDAAVVSIDFVGAGVTATQTAPGAIEVNIPGGGGGGGAFKGALVFPSANLTAQNFQGSGFGIPFDSEVYDTDGFHSTSSNTSRLTIPSGVSRVRLRGGVYFSAVGGGVFLQIRKNGSASYDGLPMVKVLGDGDAEAVPQVSSPVLSVSAGDYFELWPVIPGDNSVTVHGTTRNTWFAIEVVE